MFCKYQGRAFMLPIATIKFLKLEFV